MTSEEGSVYVPMPAVRIEASYPATDGRCPETVVVVWEREAPPVSGWVTAVIHALATVPHARTIIVDREMR